MRDIKFTCVKYLHYLWIHYYYIHPVPDRFTRNRKAYAKPETFVSAPWCLGEFRSNFRIIHSAQTYRSPPPPHPYKPSFANVERNQSTWKICYSYVPYIVYTTHNIRVLLLCRDTVHVHFFVAAPYIIYTYILYICIYRWVLYTRERSYIYIYIFLCVIDGWTGMVEFRSREIETSARPIRRRHRQNALIIAGYIFLYALTCTLCIYT